VIKRIVIALVAIGILIAWTATPSSAKTPPGNDGGYCHGANHESCRPDPQPSHGQDCQPHGNNPDGNDDHCGPASSASPSPSQPSPSPTSSPSASPGPSASSSPSPSASPSASSPGSSSPNGPSVTPPATDTEAAAETSQPDYRVILLIVLIALLVADATYGWARRR